MKEFPSLGARECCPLRSFEEGSDALRQGSVINRGCCHWERESPNSPRSIEGGCLCGIPKSPLVLGLYLIKLCLPDGTTKSSRYAEKGTSAYAHSPHPDLPKLPSA